jgi:undecaprenyl diphosphate synthase
MENFKRSGQEKKEIFDVMKLKLRKSRESTRTHESRLRIRSVGDFTQLPDDLKEEIKLTDAATANYDSFYLNLAVAYGGRQEIVDCARKLAKEIDAGSLSPENITLAATSAPQTFSPGRPAGMNVPSIFPPRIGPSSARSIFSGRSGPTRYGKKIIG